MLSMGFDYPEPMKEKRMIFGSSHQEREKSANIVLSDNDRCLFINSFENPPKPNKNLKKAFSEYTLEKLPQSPQR